MKSSSFLLLAMNSCLEIHSTKSPMLSRAVKYRAVTLLMSCGTIIMISA